MRLFRVGLQMSSHGYVEATAGGSIVDIEVSPGSERCEIFGMNEWRGTLQIRIGEAPTRGRANNELREFLSKVFDLDIGHIAIVRGARSQRKKVFVGLSPAEIVQRVGRLI